MNRGLLVDLHDGPAPAGSAQFLDAKKAREETPRASSRRWGSTSVFHTSRCQVESAQHNVS